MNRSNNRRKNDYYSYNKKSLSIVRLLLFILFLTSFSLAIFTQTQAIKLKSKNKNIDNEISLIKKENEITSQDIMTLENDVKSLQSKLDTKIKSSKVAYLTFDDGPSRKNTMKILKTLKDYNIKATFFVNGHPGLEDLYKAIAKDGHALANHTYSHNYSYVYSSVNNFKKDVKKLDNYLQEITGQAPTHILRYPGGSNNTISHNYGGKNIMKCIINEMKNQYQFFDWNVDSTDAEAMTQKKDKIIKSVLRESKNTKKAIILMHDLDPKTTTAEALPEIIQGLKNQGFIFDKLSKDSFAPQFTRVSK